MHHAPGFAEQFMEAGWTAYLTLLIALASAGLGIAGCILAMAKQRAARILGIAALAGVALTLVSGFAGRAWGMSQVEAAVAHVDPADKARIVAEGAKEASCNVTLAGEFAILPALLGVAAVALGRKEKR